MQSGSIRRCGRLSVVVLATALAGCTPFRRPATHVAPLQLFGAAPALMPALQFEPVGGTLIVSSKAPVYVTVVEVDPHTHAQRVVYPLPEGEPAQVDGRVELALALERAWSPATTDELPSRAVLVMASAERLVERGASPTPDGTLGGTMAWQLPLDLPASWAAVYVWPAAPGAARAP